MKNNIKLWDSIGIGLSAICVAHCVLTPLVLSFLPALGQLISEDAFHIWIAPVLIIPAILALVPGVLKHKSKKPIILGLIGLAIFCMATYFHHLSESIEFIISLIGGMMLLIAHKLNHTYCKSCIKCENECGS